MKNTMLVLVAISAIATEKERKDSKKSRDFYTAEFKNPLNPFLKTIKRNFFQTHSADGKTASWVGADPKAVSQFIGKEIPGYIANKAVEAYEIVDQATKEVREANSFTTVVLDGENEAGVFKALGHPLLSTSKIVEEEVVTSKSTAILAD